MRFLFSLLADILAIMWIICMIMAFVYIFYGEQGMMDVVMYLYNNINKIINYIQTNGGII